MKLYELVGVKRFANMTSDEVRDFLATGPNKFRELGNGVHAVAFLKDNLVYKFWLYDSAYEKFVNYCLENQDNKFLPKFKSKIKSLPAFFLRDKNAPDRVKYILIEPLKSYKENYELQFLKSNDFKLNCDEYFFSELATDILKSHETLDDFIYDWFVRVKAKIARNDGPKLQGTIKDLNPDVMLLWKTLFDIKGLLQKESGILGVDFDLHHGNIMMRGNQLVLLDPIADWDDIEVNQDFEYFNNHVKDGKDIGKVGARK